ncbi:RecT family recombinase [Moraxella pluranimalium]|uniref:Recombinase RecT n=1 Tax=Moraxella pluranimalium TaxID=470453 RepID=A0A1T0CQM1_9GAMM|nr:RecT family recombinase [Moraxella pluranimalium]OOS24658.1 hypothetical protein B0680_04320 [Moraxella pluranimalium]
MNELATTTQNQIVLDDGLFDKCHRLAEIMASGSCTIPKHLQGKVGDCFAIIGQSIRWGMDPYAVAQKTHLVNGTLGYEAQLVIAVINAKAPIVGRLKFDYFGDWSKVKSKDDKSDDVGVVVSAIMQGESEPTTLSISMAQVGTVRNSPLWTADPRQQLAYLGAKRWARLHCPDVILGVYTPDELADTAREPKPITATVTDINAMVNQAVAQVSAPAAPVAQIEQVDTAKLAEQIVRADDIDSLDALAQTIGQHRQTGAINDDERTILGNAFKARKLYLTMRDDITQVTLDEAENARRVLYDNQAKLSPDDFESLDNQLDYHLNQLMEQQ